ncbi:hypothetical protein C9374_014523 [Naegleria lovaniensis]|uniref:U-box domain-containing protein n=1 Tax=Naegleria lovaniensis TaxID=51637 RepID=A0AA88KP73_NAELO|nr:uncharacterized protein C9374_014523 [Naegleria lovaniensis]KAG2389123.1 hypothetical protein C9374_014523 [Naegleria lovaniensis]
MFSQPSSTTASTSELVVEIDSGSDSSDVPQIIAVRKDASLVATKSGQAVRPATRNSTKQENKDGKKKRKLSPIPKPEKAGFKLYLKNTIGFLTIPLKDRRKELKRAWKNLDKNTKAYWCEQATHAKKKKVTTTQVAPVNISTNSTLAQNSTSIDTTQSNNVASVKSSSLISIVAPSQSTLVVAKPPSMNTITPNSQPSSQSQLSAQSSSKLPSVSTSTQNTDTIAAAKNNISQENTKSVPSKSTKIDREMLSQLRSRDSFRIVTCPLSNKIMSCPVMAADGIIYQKDAIVNYIVQHGCSPHQPTTKLLVTSLLHADPFKNHAVSLATTRIQQIEQVLKEINYDQLETSLLYECLCVLNFAFNILEEVGHAMHESTRFLKIEKIKVLDTIRKVFWKNKETCLSTMTISTFNSDMEYIHVCLKENIDDPSLPTLIVTLLRNCSQLCIEEPTVTKLCMDLFKLCESSLTEFIHLFDIEKDLLLMHQVLTCLMKTKTCSFQSISQEVIKIMDPLMHNHTSTEHNNTSLFEKQAQLISHELIKLLDHETLSK